MTLLKCERIAAEKARCCQLERDGRAAEASRWVANDAVGIECVARVGGTGDGAPQSEAGNFVAWAICDLGQARVDEENEETNHAIVNCET